MRSLKRVKSKKTTKLFLTKQEVCKARSSLEERTQQAFNDFAKSRQKVQEKAHLRYLD